MINDPRSNLRELSTVQGCWLPVSKHKPSFDVEELGYEGFSERLIERWDNLINKRSRVHINLTTLVHHQSQRTLYRPFRSSRSLHYYLDTVRYCLVSIDGCYGEHLLHHWF